MFDESTKARAKATAKANREARLAQGLPAIRDPLEVARDAPKAWRAAITAKCYDCVGQNADPHWQWRVGNCESGDPTSPSWCPLYPLRPHQRLHGTLAPKSVGGAADPKPGAA